MVSVALFSRRRQAHLNTAVFLDSGHTFPIFQVMGYDIADISFPDPPPAPAATKDSHQQTKSQPAKTLPPDPAIVSFSKPDLAIKSHHEAPPNSSQPPLSHRLSVRDAAQPSNSKPGVARSVASTAPRPGSKDATNDEDPARLKRPFSGLDVAIGESSDADGFDRPSPLQSRQSSFQPEWEGALQEYQLKLSRIETNNKKSLAKARRDLDVILQSTRSGSSAPSVTKASIASPPEKPKPKRDTKAKDKTPVTASFPGNGWRQSPILKEAKPSNGKAQEARGKKKKVKRKKPVKREEPTGWATEDATDIQDLGDFDFEGSLAKFDKSTVFEQFRREDSVPPEERLVGHNKAKPTRPGTFGGKNLHPSENVLDSKANHPKTEPRRTASFQADVSSESSDDSTQHALRTSSRVSTRLRHRKPTRTPTTGSFKERSNTGTSNKPEASFHSTTKQIQTASSTSNEPRITPSETPDTLGPSNGRLDYSQFFSDEHGRPCPTITPGVMSALEDIASTELSLRPNTINENAGRNLAEVIVNELMSRNENLAERDLESRPLTAIFLVGNHRVGARALAASRHLRDRGVNSVCCVLGLDRPGHQLDPELNRQLSTIRTPDGATGSGKQETVVANWREVHKYLVQTEDQGEFADVWVDALLAPRHSFDTLVPEEQTAVREMVAWANACPAALGARLIFSIDVPCGINATTGSCFCGTSASLTHCRGSHRHGGRFEHSARLYVRGVHGSAARGPSQCSEICVGERGERTGQCCGLQRGVARAADVRRRHRHKRGVEGVR
jgi:enhancer of mRNA-decapping protein 3